MSITKRIFPVAISLLVLAISGCMSVEKTHIPESVAEVRPGILQGYLPAEALPNSLYLLPPPPAEGSAALALDEEVSQKSLDLHGTPRWKMAIEDANLMFPHAANIYSCVLGVPVSKESTPHLYMLLRRTLADAALSTHTAKNKYHRTRPFVINKKPTCTPQDEEYLRKNGSYPSGHTAVGWTWALILAEISPEQSDAILARGRAFGQSRIICNAHWQSDVNAGRFLGSGVVARLHADPVFRAEMKAAKAELSALRAKGVTSTHNCKAEAEALNH